MSPHQHLRALTNELTNRAAAANATTKGKQLLCMLSNQITTMLAPPFPEGEQRVVNYINQQTRESEQRVIDESPIITIPHITNAPGIMELCNPMNKHVLKITLRSHRQLTRNNTPGVIAAPIALEMYTPIPSSAHQQIVTQHTINALMCN
jgi:hypothetical protein